MRISLLLLLLLLLVPAATQSPPSPPHPQPPAAPLPPAPAQNYQPSLRTDSPDAEMLRSRYTIITVIMVLAACLLKKCYSCANPPTAEPVLKQPEQPMETYPAAVLPVDIVSIKQKYLLNSTQVGLIAPCVVILQE